MSSPTRSAIYNIRFYDATNPKVPLGGVYQSGSITEANFLSFLEILIVTGGKPVRAQERVSGHIVTGSNMPLTLGDYDIYCDSMYSTLLWGRGKSRDKLLRGSSITNLVRSHSS